MGESSPRQTNNAFSQVRCPDQEDSESRNPRKVAGQIESLLGGKESRQEIMLVNFGHR
jgi:hypothetical protein